MMINDIIDRIKLPFRKEKELYSSLYSVIGFYPHNISFYKQALMHRSVVRRNANGKRVNNERLEFLGDAILDAIVGDIVYRHFEGKREGFLTSTRSKIVQRETLNRLASEIGVTNLIVSNGHTSSHNSYMEGNAFEALVGAIYLDRGYGACMRFMKHRILEQLINLDKVAYKEVNFKSKLLEWCQKNRVNIEFKLLDQKRDKNSPVFTYQVLVEGLDAGFGRGFSKKESQQAASKLALQSLRRKPQFIDAVFAAKANRTKMEEEPVQAVPEIDVKPDFINHLEVKETKSDANETVAKEVRKNRRNRRESSKSDTATSVQTQAIDGLTANEKGEEFDLSDIKPFSRPQTKEEIIAAAEAQAFSE